MPQAQQQTRRIGAAERQLFAQQQRARVLAALPIAIAARAPLPLHQVQAHFRIRAHAAHLAVMAQARRQLPAAAAVPRFAAAILARILGCGALFPLRQLHAQLELAHVALHEGAGAPHLITVQVFRAGRQQGQERRLGRGIAGVLVQLVGAEAETPLAQLPFRAAVEAALVKHAAIAVIAIAQAIDGHIERHAVLVARQSAAHAVLAALRQFGGQVAMRDACRAAVLLHGWRRGRRFKLLRARRHGQGAQQQGTHGDGQGGRGRHHVGKLGALSGHAR